MDVALTVVILTALLGMTHGDILTNRKMEAPFGDDNWICRECFLTQSNDSYEGQYSAMVTNRSANWHGITQDVTVQPGFRYQASAIIKLLNLDGDVMYHTVDLVLSCFVNGSKTYLKFGRIRYVRLNRWTRLVGVLVMPTGTINTCKLYPSIEGPGVNYLLDRAAMVRIKDDTDWKTRAEARINKYRKENILVKIEDMQRLVLPYVSAKAHQEVQDVFQQQLNIHQFIRSRSRFRSGARARRIWRSPWLHHARLLQFGILHSATLVLQTKSWVFWDTLSAQDVFAEYRTRTHSTSEDWKQLAVGFLNKWNFPNCVAAIDGKHIPIRMPARGVRHKGMNYTVTILQTTHEFPFGSAVGADLIVNPNNTAYQNIFYSLFNWGVLVNTMKWQGMEWTQGNIRYEEAMTAVNALIARGIKVRGHCAFWSDPIRIQDWVKALNATDMRAAIQSRIEDVTNRTRGLVEHWDVNNENIHFDFFEQATENIDITAGMFKEIRKFDNKVKLFLNDYNIMEGIDAGALRDQAILMKELGAPIGGVGIQSHLKHANLDIKTLESRLDIIKGAGLPIWITEMSLEESNVTLRANGIRDLMTLYYSYPSIQGIVLWGFWAGKIGHPDEALFETDNVTINEAGIELRKLLKLTWITNEILIFNASGESSIRGFRGDYKVIVKKDGRVRRTKKFNIRNVPRTVLVDFKYNRPKITIRNR